MCIRIFMYKFSIEEKMLTQEVKVVKAPLKPHHICLPASELIVNLSHLLAYSAAIEHHESILS